MHTASVVVNRSGRLVFPENFFPQLDFRLLPTLSDLETVIAREFGTRYRTDDVLAARARRGDYASRRELLHDIVANLYWTQRYALTMYELRPTRWRDVPRSRDGVYLPVVPTGTDVDLVTPLEEAYRDLPPAADPRLEDLVFRLLRELVRNRRGDGTDVTARNPTVAEAIAAAQCRTWRLRRYDADFPRYSDDDVIEFAHPVPELEALMRHTMVIRAQLRWEPGTQEVAEVRSLQDDDVVVMLVPRDEHVAALLRADGARRCGEPRPAPVVAPDAPIPLLRPVDVRRQFSVMPGLEALAVYKGELACTNDDLIRNAAVSWSPMTADDIEDRTGIVERRYSALTLDDMALRAARAALAWAGRLPCEIGAILVCTSTATRTMPSTAARLSAQLGIVQTHAACDLVAACAGLSYGLAEAVRLLQEVRRPVLLVTVEKFSDKVGRARTSRMLFGDGAAALIVGVTNRRPDVEVFQTYAGGPPSQAFDEDMTVDGPDVKAMVKRCLRQMRAELQVLPDHDREHGCLLDVIELIIPHQANQVMVTALAREVGLPADHVYFNMSHVGNTSAASIPIAIHDAVVAGVIDRPRLVFAPAFGAGAVAGYACLRIDPDVVAVDVVPDLAAPVLAEAA